MLLRVVARREGDTLVSYDVTTGALARCRPHRAPHRRAEPGRLGCPLHDLRHREAPRSRRDARVGRREDLAAGDGRRLRDHLRRRPHPGHDRPATVVGHRPGGPRQRASFDTRGTASRAAGSTPTRWSPLCSNRAHGSQLRRVDLDGTSRPLGIRHAMRPAHDGPPVMGDGDVRTVQGRDYYESYGGCGGAFLTRQTSAGAVRLVRVPGDEGALSLIGTRGDDLVISHVDDDCGNPGARSVLSLFDPVSQGRDPADGPAALRSRGTRSSPRPRCGPGSGDVRASSPRPPSAVLAACAPTRRRRPSGRGRPTDAVSGRSPRRSRLRSSAGLDDRGPHRRAGAGRRPDAVPLATSLEVITPDGVRHPVWSSTSPSRRHLPGRLRLADWRPELRTALLRMRRGRTVPGPRGGVRRHDGATTEPGPAAPSDLGRTRPGQAPAS